MSKRKNQPSNDDPDLQAGSDAEPDTAGAEAEAELDAEALAADPDEDKAAETDLDERAKKEANEDAKRSDRHSPVKVDIGGNPRWWAPLMVGLMVVGLVWLVTYYLSNFSWPIKALGGWNMAIGFVLIMAGFMMTTRWK